MLTSEFDFDLPPELIAQQPLSRRDESRLLVLNRASRQIEHRHFRDIVDYLRPGDVMVLNNSRVIPARLRAGNARTGGQFEVLLLEENALNDWWVMLRPGKRAQIRTELIFRNLAGEPTELRAFVIDINEEGHRRLRFTGTPNILDAIEKFGEVPLPPYIRRSSAAELGPDRERYQTVYASPPGSVAAPTAGLHFTAPLLEQITALGVEICFATLHVGLGTFAPVKTDLVGKHKMHEERFHIPEQTALVVNKARANGRRIIAVGTTSLRVLESAGASGTLLAGPGRTKIFIYPPFTFRMVNLLLTNFHLPRSTLLMLISAFASPGETTGREVILNAYKAAVGQRYRFFSYGDAMFLI